MNRAFVTTDLRGATTCPGCRRNVLVTSRGVLWRHTVAVPRGSALCLSSGQKIHRRVVPADYWGGR